MNVSLYQSAAALDANARWQEVISENLSASVIPGFKKQDLSFSAIESGLLQAGTRLQSPDQQRLSLPSAASQTNFSPGELKPTQVATDLAIDGAGFFEVQMPNGTRAYTRDGELRFNSQGQIITKQGYLVLGDAGPISVDLSSPGKLEVSTSGEVSQSGEVKGNVRLMSFSDPNLLTNIGGGYFVAQHPGLLADRSEAFVRQGYLETGNTTPVSEMVNLIGAMRVFEANQKAIQKQDERMGKLISEVANPN
jgi:flagellar basal-body rod protein FlgG